MKGWLKAGLIGGAVGIVLTIPGFLMFYLPILVGVIITNCAGILFFPLYPAVGVLASYLSPLPRTPRQGGVYGALAGLIAFGLDSLATTVMFLIANFTGKFDQYSHQITQFASLDDIELSFISNLRYFAFSLLPNILAGVIFSALGGLVFASLKKE